MKICRLTSNQISSYIIREVQIKITGYHYTSLRMANIQNRQQRMLVSMGRNGNSHSSMVGMQNGAGAWEDSLAVS